MSSGRSYLNDISQRKERPSAELQRWQETGVTFVWLLFGQVSVVILTLRLPLIPFFQVLFTSHMSDP